MGWFARRSVARAQEPAAEPDPAAALATLLGEVQRQEQDLRRRSAELVVHQKQVEASHRRAAARCRRLEGAIREALQEAAAARAVGDGGAAGRLEDAARRDALRLALARREAEQLEGASRRLVADAEPVVAAISVHLEHLRAQVAECRELLAGLRCAEAQDALHRSVAAARAGVSAAHEAAGRLTAAVPGRHGVPGWEPGTGPGPGA